MFRRFCSFLNYLYQRYWADDKRTIWIAEGNPTNVGGGTMYELLRFGGPGTTKVRPWPVDNWLLTTDENKGSDRQFLAEQGFELVTDEWLKTA